MMAWTYQAGRKDKGEEKCPNLGRLSQPDLLMDWTQGVREREESKMVPMVLASTTEPHETFLLWLNGEHFPNFISRFLTSLSSLRFPFPASAAISLS